MAEEDVTNGLGTKTSKAKGRRGARTKKRTHKGKPKGNDQGKLILGGLIVAAIVLLAYYSSRGNPTESVPNVLGQTTTTLPSQASRLDMVALNDKRCQDCDLAQLKQQLKAMFPNLNIIDLDYSSKNGQDLYAAANLTALPAIIFDIGLRTDPNYAKVSNYLFKAGPYIGLNIGANWDPYCDPSPEHCNETRCSGKLVCRQETPKTLELFIMSQCPYGTLATNSMSEILDAFKGDITFKLSYIAGQKTDGTFDSLHGAGEVAEDLRELCAAKYYPQDYKYLGYIWCRNKNITAPDWQQCATANGMDADKLKTCSEGDEGKALLADNLKIAQQLNVRGSPTFLVNNKKMFNAISASAIQGGICDSNPGLTGCALTLSNGTTTVPAGQCGG